MRSFKHQVALLCTVAFSVSVFAATDLDHLNDIPCGDPKIKPDLLDTRIIGGKVVFPGSWPWQAGLYRKPYFDYPPFNHGDHFCAGALIDKQTVITAAHCVKAVSADKTRVHLGAHKRSAKDTEEIYIDVDHYCAHPAYNSFSGNINDIAIIKLKTPVEFKDTISPVCLPKELDEPTVDDPLYVVGWGYTSADWDRQPAEELKQAQQSLLTNKQCNAMRPGIPNSVICTAHTYGSSCHGDSGGPLVLERNDIWQLAGAVSGGPPICGTENWPMYYSKISYFRSWIQKYYDTPNAHLDRRICVQ